jgi:hypothetical protein
MSKINAETLSNSIQNILKFASGETIKKGNEEIKGKKRKFEESIELQVLHVLVTHEEQSTHALAYRLP